jgi:hypothetical protein
VASCSQRLGGQPAVPRHFVLLEGRGAGRDTVHGCVASEIIISSCSGGGCYVSGTCQMHCWWATQLHFLAGCCSGVCSPPALAISYICPASCHRCSVNPSSSLPASSTAHDGGGRAAITHVQAAWIAPMLVFIWCQWWQWCQAVLAHHLLTHIASHASC